MKFPVHPAAKIFPMMDAAAFAELKADIKAHGQRDWCELYNGKLIDGRNRYKACEELGIEPLVAEIDESDAFDPIAYVVSKNLHRRHLDTSQRAMIAGRIRGVHEEAAKGRMSKGGGDKKSSRKKSGPANLPEPISGKDSRDAAAEVVNVSGKSVDHATTVLKQGSPELVEAVDRGEIAVSRAAAVAKSTPAAKQMEAAKSKPAKSEKTAFDHLCEWWQKADSAAQTRFRLWIDGECS